MKRSGYKALLWGGRGGVLLATLSCGGETAPGAPDAPPDRIVSLIPSATETIIALGAGDRLVARTEYDIDPALSDLPLVRGGLTPSLEQLTMLNPDLVVAWPDNMTRSVSGRLTDLGIELYAPQAQSLDDIYRTTRELGQMLGLEEQADSLNGAITAELESLRGAVAGRERPAVFYVVWHDPPTTAGPGTYIHELIEIVGGRNVFADAPALWPQVSMEEIVRRQPDLLILPVGEGPRLELERLRAMVGWRELQAVRDGNVVHIDASLLNRPGPNVTEAARRLARILHPEAFSATALP